MATLSEYLSDMSLTQGEFAAKAGMTQGNVSKLCGAKPKISYETAAHIEAVTGGAVPVEAWPQFRFIADRIRKHTQSHERDDAPVQGRGDAA